MNNYHNGTDDVETIMAELLCSPDPRVSEYAREAYYHGDEDIEVIIATAMAM